MDTKLYIFDADGTLCDRDTGELLPNVMERLDSIRGDAHIVIATNQGGVGFRHWLENDEFGSKFSKEKGIDPKKYPNGENSESQYRKLARQIDAEGLYMCFVYAFKSSGKIAPTPNESLISPREKNTVWDPEWRKPDIGMLNAAMQDFGARPDETVFVGDSDGWIDKYGNVHDEDLMAAQHAGTGFISADVFFGRE